MHRRDSYSEQLNTQLRTNAIGLPGVLFQSVTTMAPAGAIAFSLSAAIPFTGAALPLAVAIALIICILISINIGAMAKYLPFILCTPGCAIACNQRTNVLL